MYLELIKTASIAFVDPYISRWQTTTMIKK